MRPSRGGHSMQWRGRYHALAKNEQCFCGAKVLSCPCLSRVKIGRSAKSAPMSGLPENGHELGDAQPTKKRHEPEHLRPAPQAAAAVLRSPHIAAPGRDASRLYPRTGPEDVAAESARSAPRSH